MRKTTALGLAAAAILGAWLLAGSGAAQSPPAAPATGASPNGPAPPVEFTAEFLRDTGNVQRGRVVWQARCQFCHGKTAYPGKAPKLDPSRYTPQFVYDRVANGFQGMPPWRHEFSVDELKSVVAYVLSREFPQLTRVPPFLQKLTVPYEYPVYFTEDVFDPGNPDLVEALARKEPARRHRVFVVVERVVSEAWPGLSATIARYAERHADRLELVASPWILEGGEAVKNDPAPLSALQTVLHALRLDRQSFVVIVGGGALLDAAGYAAATAHRGIRTVRLPTTVLAQADSGVGVKNGVNAFGVKNFLGTFVPPFAVLNDRRFLESLGRRDTIAGMAEAVKVALIRDPEFLAWLETEADALAACAPDAVSELIRRAAGLHLEHIATSGDPFEMGSARPLDFGHWAAHRLESLTRNRLRHGEAVAIGIALDTLYSRAAGLLPAAAVERVLALLERLGLPCWDEALELRDPAGRPVVLDGLAEFREHLGGELTVTLLAAVGRGVEVHEMREPLVVGALDELRRRHGRP